MPRVLESIYASGTNSKAHTIVVAGEISQQVSASIASNIRVLKFSEVEREGVKVEKVLSQPPGKGLYFIQMETIGLFVSALQKPLTYTVCRTSPTRPANCKPLS